MLRNAVNNDRTIWMQMDFGRWRMKRVIMGGGQRVKVGIIILVEKINNIRGLNKKGCHQGV